jgi:hypothetical protein
MIIFTWLRSHLFHSKASFQAYLIAFMLLALPPIPMYLAATSGAMIWFWPLLALVVLGNLLLLWLQ